MLRSGLSRLESVIGRLRGSETRIQSPSARAPGLAAYWLIPRLPEIQAAFPGVRLKIVSQSHNNEDDVSGDLQIRFGQGGWVDSRQEDVRAKSLSRVQPASPGTPEHALLARIAERRRLSWT